jgi:hypothetical protein
VAARKTTASKAATKEADDSSTPPETEPSADQECADGNGAADDGSLAIQEEPPADAGSGEEGTPVAVAGGDDPTPDPPDAPSGPEPEICRICFPGWQQLGADVTAVGCEHGSYTRAAAS